MIKAQPAARVQWEEAVLQAIVASGFCRSDAQSLVETNKGETLLHSMYEEGVEPTLAAQKIVN